MRGLRSIWSRGGDDDDDDDDGGIDGCFQRSCDAASAARNVEGRKKGRVIERENNTRSRQYLAVTGCEVHLKRESVRRAAALSRQTAGSDPDRRLSDEPNRPLNRRKVACDSCHKYRSCRRKKKQARKAKEREREREMPVMHVSQSQAVAGPPLTQPLCVPLVSSRSVSCLRVCVLWAVCVRVRTCRVRSLSLPQTDTHAQQYFHDVQSSCTQNTMLPDP